MKLRHDDDNKKSYAINKTKILCNNDEMDKKGRLLPVTIITLRPDHPGALHVAEETLIRFAIIHRKHHTKYKEAADRIFLVLGVQSLFNADVGYHRDCYVNFPPFFQ